MFVKPADGRTIRHPITMMPLEKDGAEVPEDVFWMRALAVSDVIKETAPAPSSPATSETAPTGTTHEAEIAE